MATSFDDQTAEVQGVIALTLTHLRRHQHHRLVIAAPVVAFPILYLLPWNPIYPAIFAMALSGAATVACRPDLLWNTLIGGALFAAYYAVFMLLLEWMSPGYIERVWNLADLSGVTIVGIPLEELLFGFAFGTYWSGIYEHLTWKGHSHSNAWRDGAVNVSSRAEIGDCGPEEERAANGSPLPLLPI